MDVLMRTFRSDNKVTSRTLPLPNALIKYSTIPQQDKLPTMAVYLLFLDRLTIKEMVNYPGSVYPQCASWIQKTV